MSENTDIQVKISTVKFLRESKGFDLDVILDILQITDNSERELIKDQVRSDVKE